MSWGGLALSRLVYSSLRAIVAHLPSPFSCMLKYRPNFRIFATYAGKLFGVKMCVDFFFALILQKKREGDFFLLPSTAPSFFCYYS